MLYCVSPGDVRRISFEFHNELDRDGEHIVQVKFAASVLSGSDPNAGLLILTDNKDTEQTSFRVECLAGGDPPLGFQANVIYLITAKVLTNLGQVLNKTRSVQCTALNFVPVIIPTPLMKQPNNFLFFLG